METLASPSLVNLLPALVGAQSAFAPAFKDARNDHFGNEYVTLGAAIEAVVPALNANGLALVQQTFVGESGGVVLRTVLWHVSGEWISSDYPIHPMKPDPQSHGSALTYARRYTLMALVCVAPEDDDGAAASEPQARPQPAPKRERRPYPCHPAQTEIDWDALAVNLADELDDAATDERLAELLKTLQTLPESLRAQLRPRWLEAKKRVAEKPTMTMPAESTP